MAEGEVGAAVRARRTAAGLSLGELAARSGVSATMLSEVERGLKNPTVRLAWQVARALGCSLSDLIEDDAPPGPSILRADRRRSLVDPETGVERHGWSGELRRRGLELVSYRLPAGASSGELAPNRAGVHEWVGVTRGELALVLAGVSHRLARGDSATYAPQVAVEYRNAGRGACEFLLVSDARGVQP
jgi:transcriptional regulator with XRE-family HTH domain